MATFHFDLVSPEKLLFSGEVEQVDLPGSEGDFGVLAVHAPIVATLRPGILVIHGEGAPSRRPTGPVCSGRPRRPRLASRAKEARLTNSSGRSLHCRTLSQAYGVRSKASLSVSRSRSSRISGSPANSSPPGSSSGPSMGSGSSSNRDSTHAWNRVPRRAAGCGGFGNGRASSLAKPSGSAARRRTWEAER